MSRFVLLLCLFTLTSSNAFAQLGKFNEFFDIVRDAKGQIVEIVSLEKKSTHQPGLFFKQQLLPVLAIQQSQKNSHDFLADNLKIYDYKNWKVEDKENLEKTVDKLKSVDVQSTLSSPEYQDFIKQMNSASIAAVMTSHVLARPYSPLYFYNHNVMEEFARWAMDLAFDTIGNGPGLTLINYLIGKYIDQVNQKQVFYQNMLLYYLDYSEPGSLGLTAEEQSLIRSSIFDNKMVWYKFWERQKAKHNWDNFGEEELAEYKENCDDKRSQITVVTEVNFAFAEVEEKAGRKIVNLYDDKSLFDDSVSDAYIYSAPGEIAHSRIILEVLGLALEFSPLPGIVQSALQELMEEKYLPQIETEAFLYAHFVETSKTPEADIVLNQSVNPILQKALK